MNELDKIVQSTMMYWEHGKEIYDSYYWVGLNLFELLNWLIPAVLLFLIYILSTHPLFFLARKNPITRLHWKKINVQAHMKHCALSMARREHYGLKPTFDIILYRSDIFSSVEILALGSKKFALFVPEIMWKVENDVLLSRLMHPKVLMTRSILFLNTLVLFFANTMKTFQIKVFDYTHNIFQRKELKQFFSLSLYFFFLPIIYTRLSLRLYVYQKLMTKLFGTETAHVLSVDLAREFDDFLHKPISYFFGQLNEKN